MKLNRTELVTSGSAVLISAVIGIAVFIAQLPAVIPPEAAGPHPAPSVSRSATPKASASIVRHPASRRPPLVVVVDHTPGGTHPTPSPTGRGPRPSPAPSRTSKPPGTPKPTPSPSKTSGGSPSPHPTPTPQPTPTHHPSPGPTSTPGPTQTPVACVTVLVVSACISAGPPG